MKDSKVCSVCGERKHLDEDNWRRDRATKDGWQARCKDCAKETTAVHYRQWTRLDVKERGSVGVRCLLWAPACQECESTATCWRLEEDGEDDPVPLIQ